MKQSVDSRGKKADIGEPSNTNIIKAFVAIHRDISW